MPDEVPRLTAARILVLEDEYLLAWELTSILEEAGARVIGPFPTELEAKRALAAHRPDCAFLDVNLGHGPSYLIAQDLVRREIPFAFVTGYDAGIVPAAFAGVLRIEKPTERREIILAAAEMLRAGAA